MYKGLVACRAGMGSSVMLKIQTENVIKENNLPISVEQSSLDSLPSFDGELLITLDDVASDLKDKNYKQHIIGINNIMDKEEILGKINDFLNKQQ